MLLPTMDAGRVYSRAMMDGSTDTYLMKGEEEM